MIYSIISKMLVTLNFWNFSLSLMWLASLMNGAETTKFNRDHLLVHFNPFVSSKNAYNYYNATGMMPMMKTMATKFSKISSISIYSPYNDSSIWHIPAAVAFFNRDHRQIGDPPLELFPAFTISREQSHQQFEQTQYVFDQANSIYNGTIQEIMFYVNSLDNQTVVQTKPILNAIYTKLQTSSPTQYKIGCATFFGDCNFARTKIPQHLSNLSPHFRRIELHWYPSRSSTEKGAEYAGQQATNKFTQCKSRLEKHFGTQVDIGFITGWLSAKTQMVQSAKEPVKYWEIISKWAEKTNTTVVLDGAFDIPGIQNSSASFSLFGWWKLDENITYQTPLEYVFIEKEAAINDEQEKRQPFGKIFGVVVLSVAVSIALLISIFGATLYRKLTGSNMNSNTLKKSDIREFFEGSKSPIEGDSGFISGVVGKPYNKDLELNSLHFKIDTNKVLRTGKFVSIYQGIVEKQIGQLEHVAVKLVKSPCPSVAFKKILSEIKIMSYLGKHDNIVNIVGAYTRELKQGKLFVFLELSPVGSLEDYLRNIQTSILHKADTDNDTAETAPGVYCNKEACEILANAPVLDMHRWSKEIACGMEFLASKNIVQCGALRTRNVLLTVNHTAKISDFGMSRRHEDYEDYVQREEHLSWRWLSPESLRSSTFNEKTDVWSFGVTMWEIYSLGHKPYSELSWSIGLTTSLEKGISLGCPKYGNNEIYEVILKCCTVDPELRPTFVDLLKLMESINI